MLTGTSLLINAQSVLSSEGIWWWLSTLVKNFIEFPPLGIVLVGMLGIGLAERCGLLPALIVMAGNAVKDSSLVPSIIFIGIMSSMLWMQAMWFCLPLLQFYFWRQTLPGLGDCGKFCRCVSRVWCEFIYTSIDPLLAGFTEHQHIF